MDFCFTRPPTVHVQSITDTLVFLICSWPLKNVLACHSIQQESVVLSVGQAMFDNALEAGANLFCAGCPPHCALHRPMKSTKSRGCSLALELGHVLVLCTVHL